MGRREKPVHPGSGPVQQLAAGLRRLREGAGDVTYRVMAQRSGYSVSTLSRAAAGEQLPSLAVTLAYVKACGGDAVAWERRWHEAAREEADQRPAPEGVSPPYRGLARFEPNDAGVFFGRDKLISDLADMTGRHRISAVVGASGSGKSSLLRAGLIPRLRAIDTRTVRPAAVRVITPGLHPMRGHEQRLTAHRDRPGDTWLVVDQVEELYTLCTDPTERMQFLDRLLTARDPASQLRVVVAIRADFFGQLASHRALVEAVREATLLVPSMSRSELRDAIVKPAQAMGLMVERTLTARIIEEVDGHPGGLPLMSHALQETWRLRRGRVLGCEAYEAAGGVHGALAQTAEDLYTRLAPAQASHARQILLRLITPGQGAQDTRRPVSREEVALGNLREVAEVLERLARARLITLDGDIVELAHEALIEAWPRLREWIDKDRERLHIHRRLTEAAHAWEELARDPGALYRGSRLIAAEEAFPSTHTINELTPMEKEFLRASQAERHRSQVEATRTRRRLTRYAITVTLLLILSLFAVAITWDQIQRTREQRREAVQYQQLAFSRQLAAQSDNLRAVHPDLAALLAVHAYRAHPTKEATTALYDAAALPLRHRANSGVGAVSSVAFSPDGRRLAGAGRHGRIQLWDVSNDRLRAGGAMIARGSDVKTMTFSPNGRTLASAGKDGKISLWDVSTKRLRLTLARHSDTVRSMIFSPDGRTLVSGSHDGTIRLWNAATGKLHRAPTRKVQDGRVAAFSPNGRIVAISGGDRGKIQLWDTDTMKRLRIIKGDTAPLDTLAFSPDGQTVAGAENGTVRLWNTATGKPRVTLSGHNGSVHSATFSPNGRFLATGGQDRKVRVWDLPTGTLRATLPGHTGTVRTVAFSPDSHTLVSSGDDGTVRLWDPATRPTSRFFIADAEYVNSVAFGADQRVIVSGQQGTSVRLWKAHSSGLYPTLIAPAGVESSVAFSPEGRVFAHRGEDGKIRVWNAATGKLRTTLSSHASDISFLTLGTDGRTLATGDESHGIQIWDTTTGAQRATLSGPTDTIESIAISPDGRTLASGDSRYGIRLWDTATGALRTTLTTRHKGVYSTKFIADGRMLAILWADEAVGLWKATTGKLETITPDTTSDMSPQAFDFSPDGHTVAMSDLDGTVQLWDLRTKKLRASLKGHAGSVLTLAFSPDGRTLVSGGDGGAVRLWDASLLDSAATIAKICRSVNRALTEVEKTSYYVPEVSVGCTDDGYRPRSWG